MGRLLTIPEEDFTISFGKKKVCELRWNTYVVLKRDILKVTKVLFTYIFRSY